MALVQYKSETIEGLQVVIDHQTGKVYATQSALARLIGKSDSSVRFHEKMLIERSQQVDKLDSRVMTPGGMQSVKLYGEAFISSLLVKYQYGDLERVCLLGINTYLKAMVGLVPSPITTMGTLKPQVSKGGVCYVYIFEDEANGVIKVGITNNLTKRHSSLECAAGRDLTLRYKRKFNSRESAYHLEQSIHNRLKFNRMNGEWFDILFEDLPDTVKRLLK